MLFLVFMIVNLQVQCIWWVELQASYLERVDLFLCVCIWGCKIGFRYKYICV